MSKLKIPFGLKDGQLPAATSVPTGLACGCFCPGCGARLIAKHPKAKVAHFAHHSAESCSTGYETAIHLAAKQVLLQRREVFVPAIAAKKHLYDEGTGLGTEASREISAKLITLNSVEEESHEFEGIVPDIVANYKDKLLFIEVAVTHFVDQQKLQRLRQLGIPTLEIDLSKGPEVPTMDDIEKMVSSDATNRIGLTNPRQQKLQKQVDVEAQRKFEALVEIKLGSKLFMLSEHDNYMKLPDDKKLQLELAATGRTFEDVRPYIGHSVRGAKSFGVKPIVWQASVFRMFVCAEQTFCFDVDDVCLWLEKHLTLAPPFPKAEKVAVWDYLVKLEEAGILVRFAGRSFMVME